MAPDERQTRLETQPLRLKMAIQNDTAAAFIEMRITFRSDGMETARSEWGRRTFEASSRNGASSSLARVMVAAGVPNHPVRADQGYTSTLHGLAAIASNGERMVPWTPHPHAETHPAVMEVVRAAAERRAQRRGVAAA